jgi:hypothetical protein
LKAFFHGDGNLFSSYPELQEALVWVYFHSNIPEFNKVECWGPLKDAAAPCTAESGGPTENKEQASNWNLPEPCQENCKCCFPPMSLIPWSEMVPQENKNNPSTQQSFQQAQQP